ncbi:hypothetical protein [Ellagibacter isourolithinifaciens]|uniref:hypothetical protein n=1 Tax=Ellagibacter isourolithinifaciens TaxID=2137581 RepID=UPI003A94B7F7
MDICLSHISAFRWLMRNPNPLVAQKRARYRADAPDAIPSPTRCRELALELDPERVFLDFLSSSRRGRNNDEHFAVHVQTEPLPPKSFIRIGAIGRTAIYVASPELVFMQLAQRRPLEEAVYFGFALCSLYRIDPTALGGLRQRDERLLSSAEYVIADKPLTTVKRIENFLDTAKGNLDCKKARSALKFVRDGSRSPMESALAITLGLPRIRGGFGLGVGQMNHAVRIFNGTDWAGERRYVARYPDISIEHTDLSGRKNTVGIDYDGRAFHSTASALARDARRRNEIAPIRGFTHLSINAQEATDFIAFCRFADQARRALGIRSLDRCPRNNPTAADLEKRDAIERKQLDLWRKLICQSDFRRIE